MGVGHHFVPEAVREQLRAMLSTDAYRVFKKGVTGNPHIEKHGWSGEHGEYNRRVGVRLTNFIKELREKGKLEKNKLSGAQAEYFLARIKKDGFGDERVHKFNQKVLKALRVIALGGIAAAGLNEIEKLRKFDQNPRLKNYYKTALAALRSGDWKAADKAVRGGGGFGSEGNNLINELTHAGYVREAALLHEKWKNRINDFRAIENGHAVVEVPNSFDAFVPN